MRSRGKGSGGASPARTRILEINYGVSVKIAKRRISIGHWARRRRALGQKVKAHAALNVYLSEYADATLADESKDFGTIWSAKGAPERWIKDMRFAGIALVGVSFRRLPKVRSPLSGYPLGCIRSPPLDRPVVARCQNFRDRPAFPLSRAGIMRMLQQPFTKTLVLCRCRVAQYSGHQAHRCVQNGLGRDLATGHNKVPKRNFFDV